MPQMAPMQWEFMNIVVVTTLVFLSIKMFFNKEINPSSKSDSSTQDKGSLMEWQW